MVQTKKNGIAAAGAFLLGCILAALLGAPSADNLTQPLVTFGRFLRQMSLGSASGNAGAWAIVIGLSALPMLGLLRKGRSQADLLLLLGGAEMFAMLYFLVNPTRASQMLGWMDADMIAKSWALVSLGSFAGTMVCWLLLRLLRRLSREPAERLPLFLFWTAVFYAFLLGYSGVQGMETTLQGLAQGSSQGRLPTGSQAMAVLLQLLTLIPDLLGVWVILLAGKLTLALEKAPFAGETVALAERISKHTVGIAKATLLLTVLMNAVQMGFFSILLTVRVKIQIPLLTLVLCAVLMLLCKYFRRAKEVSDDSASII